MFFSKCFLPIMIDVPYTYKSTIFLLISECEITPLKNSQRYLSEKLLRILLMCCLNDKKESFLRLLEVCVQYGHMILLSQDNSSEHDWFNSLLLY